MVAAQAGALEGARAGFVQLLSKPDSMPALGHFRPGGSCRQVRRCLLLPESGSEIRVLASVTTGCGGLMILPGA